MTKGLEEQTTFVHEVALRKEKIVENLHEQYRHVYYAYEQRTKETLDIQGKIIALERRILELEAKKPKETGESLKGQSTPWFVMPYAH